MAILRRNEIRGMKDQAIEEKMVEIQIELAKEIGKIKVGSFPENPGRVRELRKTVARILTIMKERNKNKMNAEVSADKR